MIWLAVDRNKCTIALQLTFSTRGDYYNRKRSIESVEGTLLTDYGSNSKNH